MFHSMSTNLRRNLSDLSCSTLLIFFAPIPMAIPMQILLSSPHFSCSPSMFRQRFFKKSKAISTPILLLQLEAASSSSRRSRASASLPNAPSQYPISGTSTNLSLRFDSSTSSSSSSPSSSSFWPASLSSALSSFESTWVNGLPVMNLHLNLLSGAGNSDLTRLKIAGRASPESESDEGGESRGGDSRGSGSSWGSTAFASSFREWLRRLLHWYCAALESRPYPVQMATSTFLFAIGDLTAQKLENHLHQQKQEMAGEPLTSSPLNYWRLLACSLFGLVLMGPLGHFWYTRLDYYVNRIWPAASARNITLKVVLDTLIFNPLFLLAFFSSVSAIEGASASQIGDKLWRDFVPSYAVDAAIWPWVQAFNFRFVPAHHQLLVVNLFCYFDDVFLSYVQHQGMPQIFIQIDQIWCQYIGIQTHSPPHQTP